MKARSVVRFDAQVKSRPADARPLVAARSTPGERPRRRGAYVPLLLAVAALAAGVAAAVVPATPERVAYVWPPASLPDAQPERTWFAPLMLNRRSAESIRVDMPCAPRAYLSGAGDEAVLLATARNLDGVRALAITHQRGLDRVRVHVGSTQLTAFDIPPAGDCRLGLSIEGRRWELSRPGDRASLAGTLPGPVAVNGLLTELDLRATPRMRVEVTPKTQDTRPSPLQTGLRLLALVALVAALLLVLRAAGLSPRRLSPRRLLPAPALTDLVVGATLVAWWIVAPISFDDGWVAARQSNAHSSGGFSNYYDHHAANLPYATWLESLQRLVVANTDHLVFQRIFSVLVLAALWLVVRHAVGLLAGLPPRRGNAVWWSAAAAFGLGAAGFGITLRPEPVTALLAGGVLLYAMRFAARPSLLSLAGAAIIAGLAVTAHPQGLVALAPILVCVPRIVREARARVAITPASLFVVVACGGAWTVLLGFLDSDVRHRLTDASLMREGDTHGYGLLGELERYDALDSTGASPIRREFVVLALLAVLAFLTRGARGGPLERRLPALSLGLGFLLLSLTPSKWIWHFGVLIALFAVAVAVEVARLCEDAGRRGRSPLLRPALTATAVLVATIAATWGQHEWGPLDIRGFWWHRLAMLLFPILLVLLALPAVLALARAGRRAAAARFAQRWATWAVPVVALPLLALAAIGFAVDGALAGDWATARQSVMTLAGRPTCGLADALVVAERGSAAPLRRIGSVPPGLVAPDAPAPPVAGADVLAWTSRPDGSSPPAFPWYRVPSSGRPVGLYVAGTWRESDRLVVTWGRAAGGTAPVALETRPARAAYPHRTGPNPAVWRFIGRSSLPPRPRDANALRFHVVSSSRDAYRRFVSGPVRYSQVPLSTLVERPSTVTLASPFVLLMIPCLRLPVVSSGVGETPDLLVDWNYPPAMTQSDGPFGAIPDLYQVRRLPLTDSENPPALVSLYEVAVDRRDALLPASRVVRS